MPYLPRTTESHDCKAVSRGLLGLVKVKEEEKKRRRKVIEKEVEDVKDNN